jgi:hypothetical protein
VNRRVASLGAAVPVTLAKRRVTVPPGVPPGVLIAVVAVGVPRIVVASTLRNCSVAGRMSVTSRAVSVCPSAMSTSMRYWRGKFGPVAVSSSGPR